MHQIRFRLGLCPTLRWRSLQRSPRPLGGLRGLLLRERRGGKGKEMGQREGKDATGVWNRAAKLPKAGPEIPPVSMRH